MMEKKKKSNRPMMYMSVYIEKKVKMVDDHDAVVYLYGSYKRGKKKNIYMKIILK